jgi:DNA-binding response OmpR family regulator
VTAGRTAVVVDPSPAARRRVATVLGLAGWRVVEAGSPAAGLEAARRCAPQLVVTAAERPRDAGLLLLRRLRRDGCRARFLVLADRPAGPLRDAARALGADCLGRPVDPRRLVELLHGDAAAPRGAVRVAAERLAAPAPAEQEPAPVADRVDGARWLARERAVHQAHLARRVPAAAPAAPPSPLDRLLPYATRR